MTPDASVNTEGNSFSASGSMYTASPLPELRGDFSTGDVDGVTQPFKPGKQRSTLREKAFGLSGLLRRADRRDIQDHAASGPGRMVGDQLVADLAGTRYGHLCAHARH